MGRPIASVRSATRASTREAPGATVRAARDPTTRTTAPRQDLRRSCMRADIVPGATFPDYELPDRESASRRLSELQGDDPLILTSRAGTTARRSISSTSSSRPPIRRSPWPTQDRHDLDRPPPPSQELRASVGAQWPFLADPERIVQKDLDIQEYTDPDEQPDDPAHARAQAWARRPQDLQRLLVLGRPSVEDLRHDLRAVSRESRPDWDLSTPGLREAWEAGDLSPSTAGTRRTQHTPRSGSDR